MFRRPKVGETEEDLLEQQNEFLKSSGKIASKKKKISHENKKPQKQFDITVNIREKIPYSLDPVFEFKNEKGKSFPESFVVKLPVKPNKKGNKSLFALELEGNRNNEKKANEMDLDDVRTDNSLKVEAESTFVQSGSVLADLKKTIHEENEKKLSEKSEKEILEEQKKLLETLDPNLVKFLKNRKIQPSMPTATKNLEVESCASEEACSTEEDVKAKIEKYIDSKWINIDFIEKEKLEWIGDLPDKKSLEPDQPYSARFNFKGELQPFYTEVDVRTSLYHHGEEPERPGYTIQELYQLSRSQVLQQRILALNTLANIIRKTKLGYYDSCFDGQLLHKLIESDLFFLLRFSIDEKVLIPSSVFCLYSLICNESDEYCLDRLLGVTNKDEQPLLFNNVEASKEEEDELKDKTVISYDLIKGVLRTDLLLRLAYVLSNCSPNQETIIRIVNCLIRISRHSLEATSEIMKTDNLLKIIYMKIRNSKPLYEGIKLFRVMSTHSRSVAQRIINEYDVKFFVSFLEADQNPGISQKEFCLLKLETLYFWKTLINHDLYIDEFISWSPFLTKLLLFYSQKVDVLSESDFDFELFSALASLVIVCNRKKISLDSNVLDVMKICLEKWLRQLLQSCQFNFSVSKAIGCIFRYLITHAKSFGVSTADLEFIKKLNSILTLLIRSEIFVKMTSLLKSHSCVLHPLAVTRYPDNLPSLCSVYINGQDFLKIVQSLSPFPFFISLTKYLRSVYAIHKDSKQIVELYLNSSELQNYLKKVLECQVTSDNWFMKYETNFLTDLVRLMILINEKFLFPLSFRLFPMLRVDDPKAKKILKVIFNKKNWGIEEDFLEPLSSVYSDILRNATARYKNDLIPEDWMYKILALLSKKDAVANVTNVLKFVFFLLSQNPGVLKRVRYTFRYYSLCSVFLRESNVFDSEIQNLLEKTFRDIINNREKINLTLKYDKNKSFYDLYTELIIQYAGVSYGLPIFAKFVLFPLQNNQNVSFRKLIWFEYLHALRVINLPFPLENFIDIEAFIKPCETDESLLVAYFNSTSNGVVMKTRNPFVYQIAVENIKNFLNSKNQNEQLLNFLKRKIENLKNLDLKNALSNFSDDFR